MQTKQGAARNHIESAIHSKGLEGSPCLRAGLYLIKEDESLPRNKASIPGIQGEVHQQVIGSKAIGEDILQFWVQNEIHFEEMPIIALPELPDYECLSDLSSSFDDEAFILLGLLPVQEEIIYLPLGQGFSISYQR